MNVIKTIIEQEQVNEFMRVMGQEMPTTPSIPSQRIQDLRFNLIHEENRELTEAASKGDIVEVADALCDLLYVVLGAFSAYGFNPVLAKELFDEVQRSNMSKVCNNFDEAALTVDRLTELFPGIQFQIDEVDIYHIVSRVSDNKTQKSINFSEPKLKPILRKHGVNI